MISKKTLLKALPKEMDYVDYKNIKLLKQFTDRFGRIKPRRYTGVSLQMQKKLARAIKYARYMNLMPFVK
jgi:small subunit ribosomal protein S18